MTHKLRVHDLRAVHALVRDQQGDFIEVFNAGYNENEYAGIFSTLADPSDPGNSLKILVSGEAPGTGALEFDADDNFLNPIPTHSEEFEVVDADRFMLSLTSLVSGVSVVRTVLEGIDYLIGIGTQATPEIQAVATPQDEISRRFDQHLASLYASGLTSIEWESQNGRFLFDMGGGPVPGPATGTLSLKLIPDSGGDDVITISAINSVGQAIATSFGFRILSPTEVVLEVTEA
jgi:hypothetical protein